MGADARGAGVAAGRGGRLAVLGVLAVLLAACADEQAEQRTELVDAAGQALAAGDPDAALARVREAWDEQRPDPRAALVAAAACLQLARANDAIAWAGKGLLAEPDEALAADLEWARGTGHARRVYEVGSDEDWRAANTALEIASKAGDHRVEAAMLLALLQVDAGHDNRDRFARYARLVLQLEPDGEAAQRVREAAAQLDVEL